MANRGRRPLEWSLLLIIIGVVLVPAVQFYGRLAGDVQRLSFELTARNFQAAVSAVRAEWYLRQSRNEPVADVMLFSELAGPEISAPSGAVQFYLNPQGWPANTESRSSAGSGEQTLEGCLQLWQALLQEPPKAAIDKRTDTGAAYQVQLGENGQCRYRQWENGQERRYFDYFPNSGRIFIESPQE